MVATPGKARLGFFDRSPIYWSASGYDLVMRLLHGSRAGEELKAVADLIEPGTSVVDLCCGTARLYRSFLRHKSVDYLGIDFNAHFTQALERQGIQTRQMNLFEPGEIPKADTVVMCSSFYHFAEQEAEMLARMKTAARKRVIISEPVRNLSHSSFKPFARLANWMTRTGAGSHEHRYTLETFRLFAERNHAAKFVYEPGSYNAIAIFENN